MDNDKLIDGLITQISFQVQLIIVLGDSPESRKIPFVPSRGTFVIVPKIFRDGTFGIGTI